MPAGHGIDARDTREETEGKVKEKERDKGDPDSLL